MPDTHADRQNEAGATHRLSVVWATLLVAAMLLARTPYRGVRHDAILYLGQAFSHMNPAWASRDLFFMGSSQDRYSLFSPVLGFMLRHVGIAGAEIVLLLGAWAASLAALMWLSSPMRDERARWLGLFAVACASHYYGPFRMLAYLEPFVTARTWAEPLALLAMALYVHGRLRASLVAAALAMACHPLVAIPVLAVGFTDLVRRDRRWWWGVLGALPVLGLAAAGIAPFSALFQVYDPAWLALVRTANPAAYLTQWDPPDFVAAALNLALLARYGWSREDSIAHLARSAVWATLALCGVSLVGADLLHDILITQLQLWRVLWIDAVLAALVLPSLLIEEWCAGLMGHLSAIALFVAFVAADTWLSTGWTAVLWAVLTWILRKRRVRAGKTVLWLAITGTWLAGLVVTGTQAFGASAQLNMDVQGSALGRSISIPFTLMLLALPLALVAVIGWQRGGATRWLAAGAVALLAVFGVTHWDQRSAWSRYIESTARQGAHPFATRVPQGAQVFWDGDLLAEWVLMGRPSFLAEGQLSGTLFDRTSALIGAQRLPLMKPLIVARAKCASLEWYGIDPSMVEECQAPREPLLNICLSRSVHADYLVVRAPLGPPPVATWHFAPAGSAKPAADYYLYDCGKLRPAK